MNRFQRALHSGWRARFWFLHGAILGCLLLAACRPARRADLVIANGGEPETLDPAIVSIAADMRISKALFEGLVRLDGTSGRPIPALAKEWDISPDGKVYTFHLRPGLAWSTGKPITAEDFLFSWRRALDPATASDYAGQLFYIKNAEPFYLGAIKDPAQLGIEALDARTFRVELNQPLAFFLDLCCLPTLAVVPRQTVSQYGDRWLSARPLPCSGPYELVDWRLNDRVRLKKNPRYWDAAHTRSELVDFLPVGSPNTALNLFYTGAADIIWDKDLAPVELMDLLAKRPEFHRFDFLGTCFYRFNVTRKPFDDPRVRRALALATDKERIIRRLTSGGEKPAFHFVPDGVANYRSPPGLPYDPAEARRLLAEAGFPGGKGFPRFTYSFYSAAGGAAKLQGNIAIELQQMWRDNLGIEADLRQVERKIFYSAQSRLDYDVCASSWVGDYNDANTFLDLYMSNSGNNRTGWKNAEYDELIRQANRELDLQKRAGLFRRAETLLIAKEVPVVPIYFYAGFACFDGKRIHGIHPNILDEHPVQEIWNTGARRASE